MSLEFKSPINVVFLLFDMLFAVELDNEFSFRAAEIGDISSHWKLPAKFAANKLTAAKRLPKFGLRRSLFTPQLPRTLMQKLLLPQEPTPEIPLPDQGEEADHVCGRQVRVYRNRKPRSTKYPGS